MAQRLYGYLLVFACGFALSCGSASAQPAGKPKGGGGTGATTGTTGTGTGSATKPKTGGDQPVANKPLGPTREKAQALREGADLLDKAQNALDAGNKNLAEQLFSTAELLVGADAVADLAENFRAGAPPRVTTPTVKVEDAGPQAKAVGSSEEDDADAKPEKGSLTGTLQIDGKAPGGALAFITLEPTGKKWKARKAKERIMEQRDRQFGPRLMLIPVGSKVMFPNFDKVFHNVFSTSASSAF